MEPFELNQTAMTSMYVRAYMQTAQLMLSDVSVTTEENRDAVERVYALLYAGEKGAEEVQQQINAYLESAVHAQSTAPKL